MTKTGKKQHGEHLLQIGEVHPHDLNPRETLDVADLKKSIAEHGIIVPVVVRPYEAGYQILDGHRRYEASRQLGHLHVLCVIRTADDRQAEFFTLETNLNQKTLTPEEEARALVRIMRDHNMAQKEVAQQFKRSVSWVSKRLALLPPSERPANKNGQKKKGAELAGLGIVSPTIMASLKKVDPSAQVAAARVIQKEQLPTRAAQSLCKNLQTMSPFHQREVLAVASEEEDAGSIVSEAARAERSAKNPLAAAHAKIERRAILAGMDPKLVTAITNAGEADLQRHLFKHLAGMKLELAFCVVKNVGRIEKEFRLEVVAVAARVPEKFAYVIQVAAYEGEFGKDPIFAALKAAGLKDHTYRERPSVVRGLLAHTDTAAICKYTMRRAGRKLSWDGVTLKELAHLEATLLDYVEDIQQILQDIREAREALEPELEPEKAKTLVLVACSKSKAPGPCAAEELYTGTLFRDLKKAVTRDQAPYQILSAKHGLIDPKTIISPYDTQIKDMSGAERTAWAEDVFDQVTAYYLRHKTAKRVTIYAGKNYRTCGGLQRLLEEDGWEVETPFDGLGIGQQLKAAKELAHG